MMKKLIAANWKLNGNIEMAHLFDEKLTVCDDVEYVVCPPFPYIQYFQNIATGGQDCSVHIDGAYTGEVSASMVKEAKASYCIVGHSERREYHHETNTIVSKKLEQVIKSGLIPILCVGETLDIRENGNVFEKVEMQIREALSNLDVPPNIVIAYEPVWAIGSGLAATIDDIAEMHDKIRDLLKTMLADTSEIRILYGGSVKPSNAAEILNINNVNGALVGGASLNIDDFIAIGSAS